ncbi:MAG: aryl-sulfate sulfotransferase [bacterium]
MKKTILSIFVLFISAITTVFSIPITVGLMQHSSGSLDDGYILFTQINTKKTFLIDKCGYKINEWTSAYSPGFTVYLTPDGNLLHTGSVQNKNFTIGGNGGIIEKLDWDSKVIWSYRISNFFECQHHDIKLLPNGNILAIVWDRISVEQAKSSGRDPVTLDTTLLSEKIVELRPIGKDSAQIVWEWKVWDHIVQDYDEGKPNFGVVSEHPELINLNNYDSTNKIDWLHCNSIDYNAELDQILISVCHFNEIWIIDHSTTKTQAATHQGGKSLKGGDLLYRWGNPTTYNMGELDQRQFTLQHDAYWIPKGFPNENKIMVFNNLRNWTEPKYSSVDIIAPPINEDGSYSEQLPYGPNEPDWRYIDTIPKNFYSMNLAGAQQMSNGNILICNGFSGTFFEIDSNRRLVWKYINPFKPLGIVHQGIEPQINSVFRAIFYPSDYSGFIGKNLLQKGLIENENQNSEKCELVISVVDDKAMNSLDVYPNPADEFIRVETKLNSYRIFVKDLEGNTVIEQENNSIISTKTLSNGVYFIYLISGNNEMSSKKIIVGR